MSKNTILEPSRFRNLKKVLILCGFARDVLKNSKEIENNREKSLNQIQQFEWHSQAEHPDPFDFSKSIKKDLKSYLLENVCDNCIALLVPGLL